MTYLVIDTENSGAQRNKAHPFDPRNKLCLLGYKGRGDPHICDVEYSDLPYGHHIDRLRFEISTTDVLVGFNLKYDLHWLRRYGIEIPEEVALWDCQLAEFILSRQQEAYPSLQDCCSKRSVALKSDILGRYLDMGLDVPDIPLPELSEYLQGDLVSTEELYLKQVDLIEKGGYGPLFDLQMEDQRVLADMEWNGLKYDIQRSLVLAAEAAAQETSITTSLDKLVDTPVPVNWNSPDQLSLVLYGGELKYVEKEETGFFKTGPRRGERKFRNVERTFTLPRLTEPRDEDKLAKDGYWSTAEDVLKSVQATGRAKEIIDHVLQLASINKLRTSYYEGIPRKFEYYGWEDELVHGQINQCVAITGRTNSLQPNLQNNPEESKECFVTRYT